MYLLQTVTVLDFSCVPGRGSTAPTSLGCAAPHRRWIRSARHGNDQRGARKQVRARAAMSGLESHVLPTRICARSSAHDYSHHFVCVNLNSSSCLRFVSSFFVFRCSLTPSFPACAPRSPTALPTFGARDAHPGGQPPSCEGCCRDARSPGPRRTQGGVLTVPHRLTLSAAGTWQLPPTSQLVSATRNHESTKHSRTKKGCRYTTARHEHTPQRKKADTCRPLRNCTCSTLL